MKDWFSFKDYKQKRKMRGMRGIGMASQKALKKDYRDDLGAYELNITYSPEGMWYKEIEEQIANFDTKVFTLEMPESGVILEPGAPMLPIEGLFIALPEGAELESIEVANADSFEFPGELNVIPAPEPTLDSGMKYDRKEPEYKPKKAIYGKDKAYPGELFKQIGINYIGSVKIVHLIMYPLHYKPKSKRLIIYDQIDLVVKYTPGLSIPKMRSPIRGIGEAEGEPTQPIAPQVQMEYQDQILNLDAIEDLQTRGDGGLRRMIIPKAPGELSNTANQGQYLIITTDNLVDALKPLAKSKQDKGMTSLIVTDTQIYKEFADKGEAHYKSIRDFILYAYDYWADPPEYVVIVGEVQKIPTHIDPTYNCPSDWYYSNLIGDVGPDLVLGRIAINDPRKLKRYINKVLEYEKSDGNWINRVLLTAYERDDYMNCCNDIADILKKVRKLKVIKKYGGQSTKQEVIDEIEKGCGIINYRGHGSEWEWQSSNGLGVNDTRLLKNTNKIPIIFSICCLNNAIDVPGECFGESFIEAPNGAVAFIGASRPSYTQPNHHFDRYIFRAIVNKGLRIVGKIFNYATVQLYRNFPDQYTQENIVMYLMLGDPSLEIKFPRGVFL
ncbi:MAG: C25 family cysteine peptidase [Candidatus Helarchaeota archaeon]